ncbi:MAG: glycosyltransferase family 4 protein [bacterium]
MSIPVFHSFPSWMLSGVCSWSTDLINGLPDWDQHILLTGLLPPGGRPSDFLPDLPCVDIRLPWDASRHRQWKHFARTLAEMAPCIYIPNFDFDRSCAVGLLPKNVAVCAILHSDEHCYYEEARRLGANWDAAVSVSAEVFEKTKTLVPALADRLFRIPHGIPLPSAGCLTIHAGPIRLLYTSRLSQYQKRIFDLPVLAKALVDTGVDFVLTIAGDGPDEMEIKARFEETGLGDRVRLLGRVPREEARLLGQEADVFLLTSDFEGLPISLLEAMACGAVPVAYRIRSGLGEAITDGHNGFLVPHADVGALAGAIARLANNRALLNSLSACASETVREKFSLDRMCAAYAAIFTQLAEKAARGECIKRFGNVRPILQKNLITRVAQRLDRIFKSANI